MYKLFTCLLTTLMVVYLPHCLAAQEPDGAQRPRPDAQPPRPNPQVLFNRLDANHDGAITSDEIPASMPERFKQLLLRADGDNDKKITSDELTQAIKNRQPGPGHAGPIQGPEGRGPERRPWQGPQGRSAYGPYGQQGPGPGLGPPGYPGPYFGMGSPPYRPHPDMYAWEYRGDDWPVGPPQHRPWQPYWAGPQRPWPPFHQVQYRPVPPYWDLPHRHWQEYSQTPKRPGFDLKATFDRLDKDQNQQLSFEEFSQGMRHLYKALIHHRQTMVPPRPDHQDAKKQVETKTTDLAGTKPDETKKSDNTPADEKPKP